MSFLTKTFILGLFFVYSFSTFASHYFTEIYKNQDMWQVDHFLVEPNKLQERLSSRAFTYQFQALAYSKTLDSSQDKSPLIVTVSEVKGTPLWKVTNSWSQLWEEKYAQWVEKNFDVDFFVRHNFETDCADVAYALRWIFARNNNLPAAGTLAGSEALVTHEVMKAEWLKIPTHSDWSKDQRFQTALRWLLKNVFTGTLYKDAYPIELRKETIMPGLVHLTGGGSHTEVFNKVSFDPEETPLEVLSSTLPVAVRTLSQRIYMDDSATDVKHGGLIKFRWPVLSAGKWKVIAKDQMPFYSLEQYEQDPCKNEMGLAKCIMHKLGITFQPELIVKKVLKGHEANIKDRLTWVKEGFAFCQVNDCAPGTQGYEDYGTPSRDKRLSGNFDTFSSLCSVLGFSHLYSQWEQDTVVPELPMKISMRDFRLRLASGFASYDPRDSIGARWALSPAFIKETVTRKFEETQVLRQALIQKAAPCRADPVKCQSAKSSFSELSSTEVDIKARSILSNWTKFCLTNECPESKNFEKAFSKIWGQSPAPWDSLAERMGDQASYSKGHILNAQSFKNAGPDYLILHSSKLYDIGTRQTIPFVKNAEKIDYDESLKSIVVLKEGKIQKYNLDLTLSSEMIVPFTGTGPRTLHLFGNSKALLYDCNDNYPCFGNDKKALFIDLVTLSITSELAITSPFAPKASNVVMLKGVDNYTFVRAEGSDLKIFTIPPYGKDIQNFRLMNNDDIMATGSLEEGYWGGYYSDGRWTILSDKNYVDLKKINSHYFLLTAYTNGPDATAWVIDQNKNLWLKEEPFSISLSPGKDKTIGYKVQNWEREEAFLFDGPNISAMNYKKDLSIMSTWTNVYSAVSDTGAAGIYSYDGKKLESTGDFVKSNCYSTEYSNICSDDGQDLQMEYYKKPSQSGADNYTSYYKLGLGKGLKMQETYVYSLESVSNSSSGSVFHSSSSVKTGRIINLDTDFVMWLPK